MSDRHLGVLNSRETDASKAFFDETSRDSPVSSGTRLWSFAGTMRQQRLIWVADVALFYEYGAYLTFCWGIVYSIYPGLSWIWNCRVAGLTSLDRYYLCHPGDEKDFLKSGSRPYGSECPESNHRIGTEAGHRLAWNLDVNQLNDNQICYCENGSFILFLLRILSVKTVVGNSRSSSYCYAHMIWIL